jgi:hypothetical protein
MDADIRRVAVFVMQPQKTFSIIMETLKGGRLSDPFPHPKKRSGRRDKKSCGMVFPLGADFPQVTTI